MSTALVILCIIAPIGAVDVLYYHLYRFRLFEREASAPEEITHLIRHVCFLAIVALLAGGTPSATADKALLVLLAVDLLNSTLDVILEPRSRASLGALPPGEYLLHFLGTFGSGLAAAAYLLERGETWAPAPLWQVAPLLLGGGLLFIVELVLFGRTCVRRAACWKRCCFLTTSRLA
ncbi:MAG: hypothetical protein LC111_14795 [Bacteroidia bacterium]|nr:hypothetical protein [Bacteroidia bacterium]